MLKNDIETLYLTQPAKATVLFHSENILTDALVRFLKFSLKHVC